MRKSDYFDIVYLVVWAIVKILGLWPQYPQDATTFCKWILTTKEVIKNDLKCDLLTSAP